MGEGGLDGADSDLTDRVFETGDLNRIVVAEGLKFLGVIGLPEGREAASVEEVLEDFEEREGGREGIGLV